MFILENNIHFFFHSNSKINTNLTFKMKIVNVKFWNRSFNSRLDCIGGYGGGGLIQVPSGRRMCLRSDENSAKYCSAGMTLKNLLNIHSNKRETEDELNAKMSMNYWQRTIISIEKIMYVTNEFHIQMI